MNHVNRKKPRPKPVTTDEYRRDRDYWKRLATSQQATIDTVQNQNDRLVEEAAAARDALHHFRSELQKICPHERTNLKRFAGQPFCEQCKQLIAPSTKKE